MISSVDLDLNHLECWHIRQHGGKLRNEVLDMYHATDDASRTPPESSEVSASLSQLTAPVPKNIVENAENNCERNSVMKKIHRTNLLSKIISFMLTFVMMGCMLVPVGYADSPDEYVTDDEEETVIVPFELPLLPGDLTPEEAKDAVLDMTTVPACISAENVEEQKHIKRLYEQEPDDYTIMFQNRDLSKTTYVFSVPVKNSGNISVNLAEVQRGAEKINSVTSGSTTTFRIENAALTARLGNPDIPGGLMSYNIGSCVIKSLGNGDEIMSGSSTLRSLDITDDLRRIADDRAGDADGTMTASMLDISVDGLYEMSNGGISYMMINTSDIAGDYLVRGKDGTQHCLKNSGNSLTTWYGTGVEARWLLEAYGGNKFVIRSQSSQTMYMMERSDAPVLLYYEYSQDHEWYITFESTVNGTQYWSIQSVNQTGYLTERNHNVVLEQFPSGPSGTALWELCNKVTCIDVSSVTIADHANVIVGDELDLNSLITYNPANATYKNITVTGIDENLMEEGEDATLQNIRAVGVNKVTIAYSYNDDLTPVQSAIICSTGEVDIRSSYTHMLRVKGDTSKILTLNVSTSNINSTSLSLSAINETWNYVSQAFTLTEAYRGAYKVTAALSTAQYEAPFYSGNKMEVPYYLADENTKNNTLRLSGAALTLGSYNATDAAGHWYIVRNGDYYSFINAGNTSYALSFGASSVGVGSYSASSDSFKWQTSFLGMNVPLIKQSHYNYCGVASTLQILYALDSNYIDRTSADLKDQMDALAPLIMNGNTGDRSWIVDFVLKRENGNYDAKSSYLPYVIASIKSGYPCIAHINPSEFARYEEYGSTDGDGHYCAVIGYDEISNFYVFSDCSNIDGNYGIYLVHPATFKQAEKGFVRT